LKARAEIATYYNVEHQRPSAAWLPFIVVLTRTLFDFSKALGWALGMNFMYTTYTCTQHYLMEFSYQKLYSGSRWLAHQAGNNTTPFY